MKVLILAGGFGTRLSEYTHEVPKPMVPIGEIPILVHIMSLYSKYGFNEFIVATGYKSEIINHYFKEKSSSTIEQEENYLKVKFENEYEKLKLSITVTLLFTGENTMTGGRVKRAQQYINDERFMMTYGDGISNVNISELLKAHDRHGKIATLSAVRPPVRFGELELEDDKVISFAEKPRLQKGWINGGFFVFESSIFNYIEGDHIMLERQPLEKLVELEQLCAFKHNDFWQCMDTKRDKDKLEELWSFNKAPWL